MLNYLLILIAFPFFASTASLTGKYQRLTDTITTKTVSEEIFAEYGNSGTVVRSIGNNLGLLREFGFIKQMKIGVYSFDISKVKVNSPILKKFMVLAVLSNSQSDTITLESVNQEKMFYGLDYYIQRNDLSGNDFDIYTERTNTYIEKK